MPVLGFGAVPCNESAHLWISYICLCLCACIVVRVCLHPFVYTCLCAYICMYTHLCVFCPIPLLFYDMKQNEDIPPVEFMYHALTCMPDECLCCFQV